MAARTEAGTLEQFIYDGVPGTAVSNLTQHAGFPTQPDLVLPFNLFTDVVESAPGGQNYGSWTRGWLQPPQTGYYTFWLAADDSAELWVSTNTVTRPEPARLMAQVLAPVQRGEYDRYLPQKSTAVWLERGEEYYFAVLHKQGEGDGFFHVGWQLPDGAIERPMPLKHVQPFVPRAYSGNGITQVATTPPEVHTFFSGTRLDAYPDRSVVIAPALEARPPVSCQWYRNGAPIDGAILPWLEWGPDFSADFSAKFTLVVGTPDGFAISPDFQFSFVDDPVSFLALRAETLGNPTGFNITFSRPVRPDTATNAANYRVDHGVTVLAAEWQHGTNTQVVAVQTTPLQPDVAHRVTLQGIVAANESPLPFGSQLVIQRGDGGIGAMTDIPPGPVLPLPCIGCPPTASTNLLTSFESPELPAGNRTVNVRGYLTPVETADYVFHLSASGVTFLHLSADESPENRQLIALEPEWHPARSWTNADRRARTNSGSPLIAIHFPEVDLELPVNQSAYTVGAIRLEAGRRYYIEAEMPGGGGLNQVAVLVRKAADPLPADGAPPIPGEQLAWLESDFARAPVAITQHPATTNTLQGRPAEFAAGAVGSPLLKAEWLRNGLPVADADEPTLTIPEAPLRDHQARYSVRVRNAFSEALSAEATLTVVPDRAGPQLLRARGSQRGNDAYLTFNEPIRPDLGVSPFHFSVVAEDDGTPLDVMAVELWGDELNQRFSEVRLVTEPQTPGRRYVVTAQGQYDLHDNVNHGSTAAFSAWVLTPGFALYERYDVITGYSTTNLTGAPKYPHHPDAIAYLNQWETRHDAGDNYGARLSGLVVPPASGDYQFYLTASDQAFMYLASESSSVTLEHVASAWTWGNYREWTPGRFGEREPPRPRPPQPMLAGERRYLEILYKEENFHDDYVAATWRGPGEMVPPNGSPSRLTGNVIAAWADPDGLQFNILSEPQDQVVSEGGSVSFAVSVTASDADGRALPLFHQWQTNGVEVAGANSPVFTMNNVPPAADGLTLRCRIWAPGGSIITRTVRLTVFHGESWVVAVASGNPSLNQIVLNFMEPIQAQSALNLANYSVDGLAILSAELLNSNRTLVLTTSSQEAGRQYTLNYHGLIDASIHGNVLPPGDLIFTAWTEEAGWVRIERYDKLPASTVGALVSHATFPHRPAAVEFLPRLEAEHAFPNALHRGFRLSGRLRPPATGAFDFYIAASGQALLSLSPDESVEQLTPIAAEPEGQVLRDYAALPGRVGSPGNVFFPTVTTLPVNQSHHTVGFIPLAAEREYAFEVLAVEDSPAHFVSVVMVPAGSPVPEVGTPGLDGRLVINFTNPDNRIEIEPSPPYIFTSPGSSVTLSIHTKPGPQPVLWQWLRDGLELPGETSSTLTFMASPGLHGARFQCRLAGPGSVVVSDPTLIAVNHAPLELVGDEDFLSVRLPPLTAPAVLQRRVSFGNSEGWLHVGTVAPGSGTTAFTFPKRGAQHYFRIAP